MGKVRGILLNPTLRSTIEEVLALPQAHDSTSSDLDGLDSATESTITTKDTPASNNNSNAASTACSTPAASLARAKASKLQLSSCCPLSIEEATSALEATCDNFDTGDATAVIPLDQISALKLLLSSSTDQTEAQRLLCSIENAIRPTVVMFERKSLVSSPTKNNNNNNNNNSGKANEAFQKRMTYLRQLAEEKSYLASTSNIQNQLNAHSRQDDVNVKSMMYATSVGLNMIVAPLSFGVFMYFFAGSLFAKFFPIDSTNNHRAGEIDVRQVIAGVISGVILLFIEMILFVIRSHELDKSVRKKSRMREYKSNPFGYTSRAMEKTYNGEMD
jgi:hypothetical protein